MEGLAQFCANAVVVMKMVQVLCALRLEQH